MTSGRVVALSGGVGGAKLALGLSRVLPDGALAAPSVASLTQPIKPGNRGTLPGNAIIRPITSRLRR